MDIMTLLARLKGLWRRIRIGSAYRRLTEGLTLQELWARFRGEAGGSYRHYAREVERSLPAGPGWNRRLKLVGALFWAMLLKLSPARRVFLLLALLLLLSGGSNRDSGRLILGAAGLLLLLALELADRVALKRDLEIARDIQRWLLPQAPPQVPGVELAFRTRPANTVAGDYFDAFMRPVDGGGEPSERLLIVVADVAGKGMPAALLMATFQSSLKTLTEAPLPLPDLVARLNHYSCRYSPEGRRFTTAVFVELDPATGRLVFINAGHNLPVLRRRTGEILRLEAGGLPLGIRMESTYESGAVSVGPGDRLVIFTDGVVEAENERGEDFGEGRLLDLIGGLGETDAPEALQRVMNAVESFIGGAGRQDDVTCLVMRCTRPGAPAE